MNRFLFRVVALLLIAGQTLNAVPHFPEEHEERVIAAIDFSCQTMALPGDVERSMRGTPGGIAEEVDRGAAELLWDAAQASLSSKRARRRGRDSILDRIRLLIGINSAVAQIGFIRLLRAGNIVDWVELYYLPEEVYGIEPEDLAQFIELLLPSDPATVDILATITLDYIGERNLSKASIYSKLNIVPSARYDQFIDTVMRLIGIAPAVVASGRLLAFPSSGSSVDDSQRTAASAKRTKAIEKWTSGRSFSKSLHVLLFGGILKFLRNNVEAKAHGITAEKVFEGMIFNIGIESEDGPYPTPLKPVNLVSQLRADHFDAIGISPDVETDPLKGLYKADVRDLSPFRGIPMKTIVSIGLFHPPFIADITDYPAEFYQKAAEEIFQLMGPETVFFLRTFTPNADLMEACRQAGLYAIGLHMDDAFAFVRQEDHVRLIGAA